MKVPKPLTSLVQDGLVDEVVGRLMSGKEADVYVVTCGEVTRCAKVYKDASQRSFRHRTMYTEGRSVRNSRRGRAMEKKTRYGREEQEEAWQNMEVQALAQLKAAGVHVPATYAFLDGVLLMELVRDEDGNPAPRLNDVKLLPEVAREYHKNLMQDVVRMLCAGIIHGDLSEFNILLGAEGPVIIDLPQAIYAAGNNQAEKLLARDIQNLTQYFGRFAPEILNTQYEKEIWSLYKKGELKPDSKLTGRFHEVYKRVNLDSVFRTIEDANLEEKKRRERE